MSKAKSKVLWIHRRGGKGWFSNQEGIASYSQCLGTQPEEDLVPGFHAWTVAPTFPQSRQSESELEAFLPNWSRPPSSNWDTSRGHSKADHTFLLNGSQHRRQGLWEVKSAHDPETLQTVGLDFLHVQECQDIPEAAFDKLLPTLDSPGRMGLAIFEGIPPDDPDHWFARLMIQAEEDTTGYYYALRLPYTNNLDLKPDTVVQIERHLEIMLERDWRRMYMAELPEGTGNFLGYVDGCISNASLLELPEKDHRYVMGIDVAKKVDFTVIIVMDACHRRVIWERRIGGMDWVVQEEAILQAARDFRVSRIRIDSTGVGDPLFDRLRFQGLPVDPFIFTNESKYQILTGLAVGIEKRAISYPNVPIMLRELRSLRAVKLPSGRSRVQAPTGSHDDYPMSLAMAYSLCDQQEFGTEAYKGMKPVRYAPAIDTTRPMGLRVSDVKKSTWRELRKEARTKQRIKELQMVGIEV
jgi:hypothetical protein